MSTLWLESINANGLDLLSHALGIHRLDLLKTLLLSHYKGVCIADSSEENAKGKLIDDGTVYEAIFRLDKGNSCIYVPEENIALLERLDWSKCVDQILHSPDVIRKALRGEATLTTIFIDMLLTTITHTVQNKTIPMVIDPICNYISHEILPAPHPREWVYNLPVPLHHTHGVIHSAYTFMDNSTISIFYTEENGYRKNLLIRPAEDESMELNINVFR